MTIYQILGAWLEANGYDGLYNDDCGCVIDDLCPCNDPCGDCEAGYDHGSDGAVDFVIFPTKKEQPMNEKWEPVDYDDIQAGDEVSLPPRDSHAERSVTSIVISARSDGDNIRRPWTERNIYLNRCDNRWERKTKEKPMEITVMHNAWNEHGTWMGVKKNTKCFTPGWTYELVPESKYPKMPIEDGVYRVENEEGDDRCVYLLERKDGYWFFANGVKYGSRSCKLRIIEKYQRVK